MKFCNDPKKETSMQDTIKGYLFSGKKSSCKGEMDSVGTGTCTCLKYLKTSIVPIYKYKTERVNYNTKNNNGIRKRI